MEQIEGTPFFYNRKYGIYDENDNPIQDDYITIKKSPENNVEYEETEFGIIHHLKVMIIFKKNPVEQVVLLSKYDWEDKYTLLYPYYHNNPAMIKLLVSTVPLPQGGGRRYRKSIRVRRKRGRYSRRN